jgi:hypothetical protein
MRETLNAPARACALRLCVTSGLRLVPLSGPNELRVGSDIALDFEQELRDVRGDAALALASWCLEEAGMLDGLWLEQANAAVADVAAELILPLAELGEVWCAEDGDLEAVDRHFGKHVPSAWILKLAERLEAERR